MQGHILVGITGGIAAYKTPSLLRLFVKAGYEVRTIATEHALQFVTPLTIETLTNNKLHTDLFAAVAERHTEHISLAQWADVMVVAPATANCIGKLNAGIADDMLTTTLLALNKPLFLAPAMNENMYTHFSTQKNLQQLQANGVHVIEPTEGFLACQTEGKGRMAEPETIFQQIDNFLHPKEGMGIKAVITAGPTYEPIDSVRFIGNRSSGKMGYCLAEVLARKGVEVELVSGPSHLSCNHPNIRLHKVETAAEMFEATAALAPIADIAIMAAAVADYRPAHIADHKIKKSEQHLQIDLEPTQDILKTLCAQKKEGQFFVGFALETDHEEENARHKLESKKADMIVLNSLQDAGAGFNTPTNKVSILRPDSETLHLPLLSKEETAERIVDTIFETINKKR
ncbi:MAG: bifunctional phosphopantothenoylcysteine decarboxylase/phosphopantothenate--cysteine ligase CoaBC [Bacteroidales bacterium]|nr:bifunctional phosphopantothenoylcysteine decarboxylase/phosphopantothenate--cysteine ligase CoaBC [Bacteroidales bacterium]